ncbi:ATPase family AAA domain-containing 3B [Hyphodiscus hymeniophilus]|uniref:ATPase family AAA domain-containing 3B n=1 Tax=Hyphodiscus hymeniophilus TaxID=353542 RepID=A0A9P6VGD9_9HELO|nr:ATPase family AAA domain-containing 3B [Hyphodiscus hymeniophilus]
MTGFIDNISVLIQAFSDAQVSVLAFLFPGFTSMSAAVQGYLAVDLNIHVSMLCFFGLVVFGCRRLSEEVNGRKEVSISYFEGPPQTLKELLFESDITPPEGAQSGDNGKINRSLGSKTEEVERVERLANEFFARLLDLVFNPAEICSFLLGHKNSPDEAIDSVDQLILKPVRAKSKLPRMSEDAKPNHTQWDEECLATKVLTEMNQIPFAAGQPLTPLSNLHLSPFKCINTLSDVQELTRAVMDMYISSAHVTNCTYSHTPPEGSLEATSTKLDSPTSGSVLPSDHSFARIVITDESAAPKPRASKLAFKTVNEIWDEKAYKYTIEALQQSVHEANELDQYVFVVRARIGHLTDTRMRLLPLLMGGEIPYDLLWALFKPNTFAYTTCPGTKKPRCIRYDFGEERPTADGMEYFHIRGRYVDFDGEVFGEVPIDMGILKFRGSKPINSLDIFPLKYHDNVDQIRAELLKCGQKFGSLSSVKHLQYSGKAFQVVKGEPVAISTSGRIMVDAAQFRKINPNYARPSMIRATNGRRRSSKTVHLFDLFDNGLPPPPCADPVKVDDADVDMQDEDNLTICSPTVLGYSLKDKLWLEFAVDDVTEISWNDSLWDHLAIEAEQKNLTLALAASHTQRTLDYSFDDIVIGKGRGLIILLYGPPGVGKTLTAEALSEYLQRPLYTISAGDLSGDASKLEKQLSTHFELADHWDALLLLDEADVFLRKRDTDHTHNSLVSVFLRKLEYYQGIMLLTTNQVRDFDDAIRSRIHLGLRYNPLGVDTRKLIWKTFLENAITVKGKADYSDKILSDLSRHDLNGRQSRAWMKYGKGKDQIRDN